MEENDLFDRIEEDDPEGYPNDWEPDIYDEYNEEEERENGRK